MVAIIFLILGFALLFKGADWLVSGSSAFAKRMKVTDFFIGLTVVAFGTSTPELFVNIYASVNRNAEIALGNILGSNTFNILIILGIAALIYPLSITKKTVWKEIPFSLFAVILLGALANDVLFDGAGHSMITRIDGFVLLSFFLVFLYYLAGSNKDSEIIRRTERGSDSSLKKSIFLIVIGLVALVLGGRLVVNSAVRIAERLSVSQSLIGLTIVAAGTSLPELATSVVAAYRKNSDIAVGNIVGSNIFNIFFILGIAALIEPLPVALQSNADIAMLVGTSLLLFFAMFTGKKRLLDRWEGVVFILLYIAYMVFLVKRG